MGKKISFMVYPWAKIYVCFPINSPCRFRKNVIKTSPHLSLSTTIQTSVDSPAIFLGSPFPRPCGLVATIPFPKWSQVSLRCTRRRRTAFARRQRCCWPTAERPPTCEMHEVPIFPREKWWICRGKIFLTLVDIAQEIQVREL